MSSLCEINVALDQAKTSQLRDLSATHQMGYLGTLYRHFAIPY